MLLQRNCNVLEYFSLCAHNTSHDYCNALECFSLRTQKTSQWRTSWMCHLTRRTMRISRLDKPDHKEPVSTDWSGSEAVQ